MGNSFNLLIDDWCPVITFDGDNQLASIKKILKNANEYYDIVPDLLIGRPAYYRQILAILTTYYSRFDAEDKPYPQVVLKGYSQVKEISKGKLEEYNKACLVTWKNLYQRKYFSKGLFKYLEFIQDAFECFDSESPYLHCSDAEKKELDRVLPNDKWSGQTASMVRKFQSNFSDSANKKDLGSSVGVTTKKYLEPLEYVQKMLIFQQFADSSVKTNTGIGEKWSHGWLYTITPMMLGGKNVFEVLMNNLILGYVGTQQRMQTPYWEYDSKLTMLNQVTPQNISDLYSRPSSVLAHPLFEEGNLMGLELKKVAEYEKVDYFLEPMTAFKRDSTFKKEKHYVPVTRATPNFKNSSKFWSENRNIGNVFGVETDSKGEFEGLRLDTVSRLIQWYFLTEQVLSETGEIRPLNIDVAFANTSDMNSLKIQSLSQTNVVFPRFDLNEEDIKLFYSFFKQIQDKSWSFWNNAKKAGELLGNISFAEESRTFDLELETSVLNYLDSISNKRWNQELVERGLINIKNCFKNAYIGVIKKVSVYNLINNPELLERLGYMRGQAWINPLRTSYKEREFIERVEKKIKTYDFTRIFDVNIQNELIQLRNNQLKPLIQSGSLWQIIEPEPNSKITKQDELYFMVLQLYAQYTSNNDLKSGDYNIESACQALQSDYLNTLLVRTLGSKDLKDQKIYLSNIIKNISNSKIQNINFSQIAQIIYRTAFGTDQDMVDNLIIVANRLLNTKK